MALGEGRKMAKQNEEEFMAFGSLRVPFVCTRKSKTRSAIFLFYNSNDNIVGLKNFSTIIFIRRVV